MVAWAPREVLGCKIGRRRLLQGAAVGSAGVAGLWAAGCGGGGDADTTPAGSPTAGPLETPKPGGRYQTAITANFDTFDPHPSIASGPTFFPRVYNVVVNRSATRPDFVFYDLAESFEQPDETSWVFKMRRGVKVGPNQLGVPERDLDAQDALVSFQRMQTEPRANAGGYVKLYVDRFEAPDNQTFIVRTKEPYSWLLSRIGTFVSCVAPRELLQGDVSILQTKGVGAGPFLLRSLVEGEGASFDRNPNYYRAPQPYVDGLDVKIIPDRAARRTAFLSRQIHNYLAENKGEADDLMGQGDFQLVRDPVFSYISFVMNPDREPWTDGRARRAMSRAINRQQFIDVIALGDALPDGVVHWPTGPYALPQEDLETKYQPYDPSEARQLLQEAGYADGIRIKMMYPTLDPIPQYLPILIEQFKEAGIEIDQDPKDFGTWLDLYRRREYDASLSLNQTYESPEVPLDFHTSLGPIGDGSYGIGPRDAEIDVRKSKATTDPDELIEAVHDAQKLIYEKDPAVLNIYSGYSYSLYWSFVKNVPQGLGTTGLLLNDWWLEL